MTAERVKKINSFYIPDNASEISDQIYAITADWYLLVT